MTRSWTGAITKNWFLIGLVVALVAGNGLAELVQAWLGGSLFRTMVVATVMFLMALGISSQQIVRSFLRPLPALLGAVINMIFVPLVAYFISVGLDANLAGGLLVAACIPCTLASSAVWTRRGGGDDTVAILVMVITNGSCFVTTPMLLSILLGADLKISPSDLVRDLAVVVLLPILLAQIFGLSIRVKNLASRHKLALGVICQGGLLIMVMLGAAQMATRIDGVGTSTALASWLAIIVSVVTVHVAALVAAWYAARSLGMPRPQQIAVAISGSQKTLMVGLKIAIDAGVSVLPIVVYHIAQLLVDTIVVDWWKRHADKVERKENEFVATGQLPPSNG